MAIKFKNNAVSTLASSITAGQTSFSLQPGTGARFPTITGADYFFLTLVATDGTTEIVKATARSVDSVTVVRAQEGTTARAFDAGSYVGNHLTAAHIAMFHTNETDGPGSGVDADTVHGRPPSETDQPSTVVVRDAATSTTLGKMLYTGEVTSTATSALQLPAGPTEDRPVPGDGKIRFNKTTKQYEGYNEARGQWDQLGAGAAGGGLDRVFLECDITVTSSYTITSGKNAVSAGPITIADGATVTVPDGSTWTIV